MNGNASVDVRFGHWPRSYTLDSRGVHIEPLSDYDGAVVAVSSNKRADKRWIHPPICRKRETGASRSPFVYASAFQLPPTHVARTELPDGREFAELAIAVLGLIEGMRLIPEDWIHFYRTPIKPSVLCDIVVSRGDIESVLAVVSKFWSANRSPEIRKSLFGAIHWFLFSQSYEHQFEEFQGQYIVFDACFKLHCDVNGPPSRRVPHAERPSFLANAYSIPCPTWATVDVKTKTCELATIRNEFTHEGRYGGQPIGFSHPKSPQRLVLQLKAFNSRLLLNLLGAESAYIHSPVDTRRMHRLQVVVP